MHTNLSSSRLAGAGKPDRLSFAAEDLTDVKGEKKTGCGNPYWFTQTQLARHMCLAGQGDA